jgi:hypothetical protein
MLGFVAAPLPAAALEHRQPRIAGKRRVGARALAEREGGPARVADQALVRARIAQSRGGAAHGVSMAVARYFTLYSLGP